LNSTTGAGNTATGLVRSIATLLAATTRLTVPLPFFVT
jgi:hypothetical protein